MKFAEYLAWLEDEKNFTARSAYDVVSRLRRAMKFLDVDTINETTIEL
jgi:hypothetical protein